LDGTDGFLYYYHDLRKDERIMSIRQMGGWSVMIWCAIGYKGRSKVVILDGSINNLKYQDLPKVMFSENSRKKSILLES